MNSVKPILENFKSFSDNVKKDILLYYNSRLDGNKNKFVLEATLTHTKVLIDSQDLILIKDSSLLKTTHP